MHSVPTEAGTEESILKVRLSDDARDKIQYWLWNCISNGWQPSMGLMDGDPQYWTHEDNQAAARLGWMIINPPSQPYLDLFSLKVGVPATKLMEDIVRASELDPLCAKAVSILTAQRFRFPNICFAFEK